MGLAYISWGLQTCIDERSNYAYSHLSYNRGGWDKHGEGAKAAKSINVEGGIFWKN